MLGQPRERHLMRAKGSLGGLAIHEGWARPPFRRSQNDHGPLRTRSAGFGARLYLDRLDPVKHDVERRGHQFVHDRGVASRHIVRLVAIALHERGELRLGNTREDRGAGDLVAVQMEDRQHRAVARGVDELVRVPARGERRRLRLAIADDATGDEIRIVECRAVRMRERVAELTALVDGAGCFGRDVARNAARK